MSQNSSCICTKSESIWCHICSPKRVFPLLLGSTFGPCYARPHRWLYAILHCGSLGLAQMAVVHRGNRPLPLQLPGEEGLLLSFFVRLGVGVWISLFSLSHFDLTPVPDSWYCSWTWHSALPLYKSGMGRGEWDWEERGWMPEYLLFCVPDRHDGPLG